MPEVSAGVQTQGPGPDRGRKIGATIAEAYELLPSQIEAAMRYELLRVAEQAA